MNLKEFVANKDRKDLAAGIVFTDGKKLLLLQSSNGSWSLPGGHAKIGETPWECAKRETEEETGKQADESFYDFVSKHNGKQFYTYFVISEPFAVKISDEHRDWNWFKIDDFKNLKLNSKFKKNIKSVKTIIKMHFKNS